MNPVIGTPDDDLLKATADQDDIFGGEGNDTIEGDGATVSGDVINGGDGQDEFSYYGFDDVAYDLLNGTMSGGAMTSDASLISIENVWGGYGNELIAGNAEANHLRGFQGNDSLDGGDGSDSLEGEENDDRLIGGEGNDALLGGDGADVAVFSGQRVDYTVTNGQDGDGFYTLVTDNAGSDGTDKIYGVESLEFLTGIETICFMPGTRIATPAGETPVEALRRGDLVLTPDGTAAPIVWMGRQTVSRRFADPLRVLPILIEAGALGEGLPRRDLLVSPDHALFLDGVLVHAGALVNGSTIRREINVPERWTYWHVELADHALVLAEGVPAESFVDNADRMAFDNWAEHEALHPDGRPIAEMTSPRAKSHRQVPRNLRRRLAERAKRTAWAAA